MFEKERIVDPVKDMFKVNMGIKDREEVLIVTDIPGKKHWQELGVDRLTEITKSSLLAKTVYEISKAEFPNNTVKFHTYELLGSHGVEPPNETSEQLKKNDITIAITSYSLSHTNAREEACEQGARIASMPGFLPEMFYPGGPMSADYEAITALCEKFAEKITLGENVRITTPAGTDIRFSIKNRDGRSDDGMYTEKGSWGNLPAGEAYTAPVEGTAEGNVVVESGWFGGLEENMTLHFTNGLVSKITGGGKIGEEYRAKLGFTSDEETEKMYQKRRNCAELGIGTNPNAERPDNVLEAEKIKKTVHVAIGDNSHMGGEVEADLHQDFILPEPTLTIDGEDLIKGGKILIE